MPSLLEASVDRALVRAAVLALKRPWTTAAAATILAALSIASGLGMRFHSEVTDLVPASTVEAFRRLEEVFGGGESAFLLVRADRPAPAELVELGRRLAKDLETEPLVSSVSSGWSELSERLLTTDVMALAPLFADPAGLDQLEKLLTPEGIRAQVEKQALRMGLPGIGEAERWAERDPLELRRFLISRVSALKGGFRFLPGSLHFLSEDARSILVKIDGRVRPADIPSVKKLVSSINSSARRAQAALEAAAERPLHLDLGLTGGYAYAFEMEAMVRSDLSWNNSGSVLLCLVLVALAYRRVGLVLPSLAALVIGMVIGFGAFSLIRREVVTLAFVSGAALAGLGIDYVIYITLRAFSDPRGPSRTSVIAGVRATGRSILLASVTTAAGFLTFPLTGEKFLSDVGLLSAVGIIACGAASIVVLPALLVPWVRRGQRKPGAGKAVRGLQPRDFGASWLTSLALAWPAPVFTASILAGLGSLAYLMVVPPRLERDLRRMSPPSSIAARTQEAIAATFGGAESPVFLFVEGNAGPGTAEVEAVEAAARLEPALHDLLEDGVITAWSSPASLIPSLREQTAARAVLLRADAGGLVEAFRSALEEEGFDLSAFQDDMETFRRALRPGELLTPALLRRLGLAAEVKKLVGESGGKGYALVAVHPAKQLWRSEDQERVFTKLEDTLLKAGVRGSVAGLQVLSAKESSALLAEFLWISSIACAAMVGIVLVSFRGIVGSIIALLPVALGTLWMMVACDLLGIRLNFMNVGVLPMVLGTGVDIGIHVARQYMDEPGHDVRALAAMTGGSVMLASLTTLASFGTMIFSITPGLASVGSMATLGTIGCLVASLVTVPATLVLHSRTVRR
jgi:hypothetical protein